MNSISARAPGKCILFGEHSVVFGYPAIAMAISKYSDCYIDSSLEKGIILNLENYDEVLKFKDLENLMAQIPSKYSQIGYLLDRIKQRFQINLNNIKITISSSLFPSAGLGSSASIAVALIAAMNSYYNTQLNQNQISHLALDMEKLIHKTPSGIDNTICTFGSMIYYEQGSFHFIEPEKDFIILVSYTNITHDTGKAVNNVRQYTMKNPDESNQILQKMGFISNSAENAIAKNDLKKLGNLMNQNQELLAQLGVSNEKISEIIKTSLDNGAFGSKLTGAGLGGCVISIGALSDLEKIKKILEKKGYPSFLTKIDREGVKIESR